MLKFDTLVLNKRQKSINQFLYKINSNTVNIVIQIKVIKYCVILYFVLLIIGILNCNKKL